METDKTETDEGPCEQVFHQKQEITPPDYMKNVEQTFLPGGKIEKTINENSENKSKELLKKRMYDYREQGKGNEV